MNRKPKRKRDCSVKATKQGATHKPPMRIVSSPPPKHVYDGCREAFELSGAEIWCYGNTIHNPSGGHLSFPLIAHERTHRDQQGDDIDGWWELYLEDQDFRLQQEMEAHTVEYRVFCLRQKNSKLKLAYLENIGERLSSGTYGSIIPKEAAMHMVAKGRKKS